MSKNGFPWLELGVLGAIGVGAYLLWSRLQAGTSTACNTLVGLPRVLCELGWQVSGGTTIFDQDKICAMFGGTWNAATGLCHIGGGSGIPDKDSHGCYVDSQHWCDTDNKCRDNAQACTPGGKSPGACYEWSPTFGKWIYSPTMPGCIPYYDDTTITETCGKYTGRCDEAISNVRSWINSRSKELLCNNPNDQGLTTWIAEFMPYDYAEVVKICQGIYDKPVTNIQKCPDGTLVDLNNPPGTTLEEACTNVNPGACKINMLDAMRGCGQTLPGKKMCCGPQNVCNAFGADIPYQGCFTNAAQLNYINCLNNACGW